jgi:hypothetical protein
MRPVTMEKDQPSHISPGGDTSALPRRLEMEILLTLRLFCHQRSFYLTCNFRSHLNFNGQKR